MPECKYCPTEIVWARHPDTGKPAPIEDEATDDGNIRLHDDGTYTVLAGERLTHARETGEHLHLNHFATCPRR